MATGLSPCEHTTLVKKYGKMCKSSGVYGVCGILNVILGTFTVAVFASRISPSASSILLNARVLRQLSDGKSPYLAH